MIRKILLAALLSSAVAVSLAETEICPYCGLGHEERFEAVDLDSVRMTIGRDSLIEAYYARNGFMTRLPLIYSGYRYVPEAKFHLEPVPFRMDARAYDADSLRYAGILTREVIDPADLEEGDEVLELTMQDLGYPAADSVPEIKPVDIEQMLSTPRWLRVVLNAQKLQHDIRYMYMVGHPFDIQQAAWNIKKPPTLPEDDYSYEHFLETLELPAVDTGAAVLPEQLQRKKHWLHNFSTGVYLSQAYVSSTWYQGGNSYFSLLFNFNWNVDLNTVFHPNLLFNSALSYKLAISSAPKGSIHSLLVSQDQLQYNLKTGFRAWKKWFYSFIMQFKTPFFNTYPSDSEQLTSSFLSPADFNIGLGMTYETKALSDRLKLSVSISPISYNLKVCNSDRIDHLQFNIPADRKTHSEIGSNAEANLEWQITRNISWKSRMFLFTDYDYFQADWENTFNFAINRFLTTQLYVHPRFDSSSEPGTSKWHHWMLKEILSIGVTYSFSTKP